MLFFEYGKKVSPATNRSFHRFLKRDHARRATSDIGFRDRSLAASCLGGLCVLRHTQTHCISRCSELALGLFLDAHRFVKAR